MGPLFQALFYVSSGSHVGAGEGAAAVVGALEVTATTRHGICWVTRTLAVVVGVTDALNGTAHAVTELAVCVARASRLTHTDWLQGAHVVEGSKDATGVGVIDHTIGHALTARVVRARLETNTNGPTLAIVKWEAQVRSATAAIDTDELLSVLDRELTANRTTLTTWEASLFHHAHVVCNFWNTEGLQIATVAVCISSTGSAEIRWRRRRLRGTLVGAVLVEVRALIPFAAVTVLRTIRETDTVSRATTLKLADEAAVTAFPDANRDHDNLQCGGIVMGTFAIEKGHSARWLKGSLARLGEMQGAGLVGERQKRVMRKFAVRRSPDQMFVLFKTSDLWLQDHAPTFIRDLEWVEVRPTLPLDDAGEETPWVKDEGFLDALLGLELSDDDQPLEWDTQ